MLDRGSQSSRLSDYVGTCQFYGQEDKNRRLKKIDKAQKALEARQGQSLNSE
jgi:hypothetical protein